MRITIDTELQAIIVPDTFYTQMDKLNEIISAAGGRPLDYSEFIRDCFHKAIEGRIIMQSEVAAMKPRRSKRSPYNKPRHPEADPE